MTQAPPGDALHDAFCPGCGHWLRGLRSNRCPECGAAVDALRAGQSQIPWVHRGRVGFVRAYVRTLWYVRTRTRRFGSESARPVSYVDASRFRGATLVVSVLSLFAVSATVLTSDPAARELVFQVVGWEVALAAGLGGALFLAGLVGIPGYFFHPRRLPLAAQNRAVALSCYTCAPTGLLPIPAALACVGAIAARLDPFGWAVAAVCATSALVFAAYLAIAHLHILVTLARNVLHSSRRAVAVGVLVPLSRLLLAGLTLLALPLATAYAVLLLQFAGE